jgi:peptide methionine sulfoxide reductase MsrB
MTFCTFVAFMSLLCLPSLSALSTPAIDRRLFLQNLAVTASALTVNAQFSCAASTSEVTAGGKPILGDESIMAPKAHGTSENPVQDTLRFGVSTKLADKICNYNRHFAEMSGYFESSSFEDELRKANGPLVFYDSVTGKPLFKAPINRSVDEFLQESYVHGWPSFRDQEVVWENVRILRNSGETVSVDGTHLGHNLPDKKGNRYCINLVSIAGSPI